MWIRFLLIIIPVVSYSQTLPYASSIVDTLSSSAFYGRGYVNHGHQSAARFIAGEYEKAGLLPYDKQYFQPFTMAVNTFPGAMKLAFDEVDLQPGIDYLIQPFAAGVQGSFPIVQLTLSNLFDTQNLATILKDSKNKALLVPAWNKSDFTPDQIEHLESVIAFLTWSPDVPAAILLQLTNEKLTWSVSSEVAPRASFLITNKPEWQQASFIQVHADQKYIKKYDAQNVIGYIPGKNTEQVVVITAHFDHLGMMGLQTMFPGANDNASGVAMLLSLMQYYAQQQPLYTTVFMAFGGEEAGLLGSAYFVENPLFDLKDIRFLLNFDLAGTGDEGIQVVNGAVHQDAFNNLVSINQSKQLLPQVKVRGEACISDHCFFHLKGVPSFYMYTLGGIKAYHDVYDKAETLPLTEFEDYFNLIIQFIAHI